MLAYLFYLLEVISHRGPQGLHCDKVPHMYSRSDVCKSTGGKGVFSDFNLSCYHHRRRESPMKLGKSAQYDEESVFLGGGFETVSCNALANPSESKKRTVNIDRDLHGP